MEPEVEKLAGFRYRHLGRRKRSRRGQEVDYLVIRGQKIGISRRWTGSRGGQEGETSRTVLKGIVARATTQGYCQTIEVLGKRCAIKKLSPITSRNVASERKLRGNLSGL